MQEQVGLIERRRDAHARPQRIRLQRSGEQQPGGYLRADAHEHVAAADLQRRLRLLQPSRIAITPTPTPKPAARTALRTGCAVSDLNARRPIICRSALLPRRVAAPSP